jgi:hypothetical protein
MGETADPLLMEAMQKRATATAEQFRTQNIANVLWALAVMGERPDRGLLEAMQRQASATAWEFEPQGVSNMLWALTVMGEIYAEGMGFLIDLFSARVLELRGQLCHEAKHQVHQWLLACELDLVAGASLPRSVARVKEVLGEECLQAFSEHATHESELQRDVAAALRSVGLELEIEVEHRDARSGYSIDVLVRRRPADGSTSGGKSLDVPSAGWAVEVDGPCHFLGDGRTPSGSTRLKRKQLGQLGYTVVPVPFWEWQALKGEEEKQRYLEGKLGGQ